jgi:hypothetical protein
VLGVERRKGEGHDFELVEDPEGRVDDDDVTSPQATKASPSPGGRAVKRVETNLDADPVGDRLEVSKDLAGRHALVHPTPPQVSRTSSVVTSPSPALSVGRAYLVTPKQAPSSVLQDLDERKSAKGRAIAVEVIGIHAAPAEAGGPIDLPTVAGDGSEYDIFAARDLQAAGPVEQVRIEVHDLPERRERGCPGASPTADLHASTPASRCRLCGRTIAHGRAAGG